jgi:sugar O-acyltransferase (sialic acid O-acetyltransferase NeuD family)
MFTIFVNVSVHPCRPCRSETLWSIEWQRPHSFNVSARPGPSGKSAAAALIITTQHKSECLIVATPFYPLPPPPLCYACNLLPLLFLGAGSMAVEALDIAEAAGRREVLGFVVNTPDAPAALEGLPVYQASSLPLGPSECRLLAAIVSNRRRAFIEQMIALGYAFETLIHPSAQISRRARIGTGCLIHPAAVVASNTVVAEHVLINRGALIGHDNHIGAFTTIGPGANLAGALTIGQGAYLGAGAVVRDHLSIGPGAVLAAGAVAVKPVDAHTLAAGVPAKTVKQGVDGL